MAANSQRPGTSYAGAYRSREGLSTRSVAASDEIQLRIDPMDLDDEITGLHRQVRRLRNDNLPNCSTCDTFVSMPFDHRLVDLDWNITLVGMVFELVDNGSCDTVEVGVLARETLRRSSHVMRKKSYMYEKDSLPRMWSMVFIVGHPAVVNLS
ncbi:hypothetical protein TanjilG_12866 [Lupinus angustifolius]|uniref:Uncharacterized protein n=1 Tax=Lupinus angustifolius TaxID=3871 RepID=A0A1J7GPW7_LUPAN|nr:hypothetical protein TanjilG_12866 [Lupinus angustifolius]